MTPERFSRLHQVLSRRQPDLTVVADKIHKGRNLAAIVRTCDAVGISEVHSVAPEAGYKPYRGTTMGAEKWVDVRLHDDVGVPLEMLKSQGYQFVAASVSGETKDFRCVDYTAPTVLIMGSEIKGVSDEALAYTDHPINIPMMGMVESFNVSVATAIILTEAQRQRDEKGMYAESRLPSEVYQRTFFEWAHPAIAGFCQENKLEYPALGDDGEILGLSEWYKRVNKVK